MKLHRVALALATSFVAVSCDQMPAGPEAPVPQFTHEATTGPVLEQLRVCKVGPAASFQVSYSPDLDGPGGNPGNDFDIDQFDLDDGECMHIATAGFPVTATIVETPAAGSHLAGIGVQYAGDNVTPADLDVPTATAVVTFGEDPSGQGTDPGPSGVTVTFTNEVDPPPPGGGEGCTPGYWKQPQHFDSWVGYDPDDLFSSVFEDAFPGLSLLDVLGNGGGGLDALGRHAVAALLNAANPNVSYDVADVVAAFNAVFPGTKEEYNTQKNIFAGFNEQGCPLN